MLKSRKLNIEMEWCHDDGVLNVLLHYPASKMPAFMRNCVSKAEAVDVISDEIARLMDPELDVPFTRAWGDPPRAIKGRVRKK